MPELPEVEVTRLSFAPAISGSQILNAVQGKPLRWPLGCAPQLLVGQTVLGVRRRGKYLLLDLSGGLLLMHLGMSGSLTFAQTAPPAGKHDHFDLITSHGVLRLHDPRRFGAAVYADSEESPQAQKLLGGLGMEPLSSSFDPQIFYAQLRLRNAPIKQVLLAGDVVVGVGNIYACEVLFRSGIRPTTRAARISRARVLRLHDAIGQVLTLAVQQGGSTLRDFSNAHGDAGHFQLQASVYGRAGQPCRTCSQSIQLIRQGQRSTYYCRRCQT